MTTTFPQLDYAPTPPLYRRRRFRRIVLVLLLLTAMGSGWRYGPRAWGKTRLLYAQHRCLAYTAPPDQVVYESDANRVPQFLQQPGYVPLPVYNPVGYGTLGQVAAHIPKELTDLEKLIGPSTSGPSAVLFLHELCNQAGHRRLVMVRRDATNMGPIWTPFNLFTTLFNPATLRQDLGLTQRAATGIFVYNGPAHFLPANNLRFYAGQVDPADPAHFTIRYEMDGQEGLIDGRLSNAGDDVLIRIKTGPAAPPSVWSNLLPPAVPAGN